MEANGLPFDAGADWKFRDAKFTADRLSRLLTSMSAIDLLGVLQKAVGQPAFEWEKGDGEATGQHRAVFRIPCSAIACDTFFNGVGGIRRHYYRGIAEGERLTRFLVTRMAEHVTANAGEQINLVLLPAVRSSLLGAFTKIWIDEEASDIDQKSYDAESLIALEVPHWVAAAKRASAAFAAGKHPCPRSQEKALLGVQAPECCGIKILGTWLRDDTRAEFLVPSKRNRGRHIRVYGFS